MVAAPRTSSNETAKNAKNKRKQKIQKENTIPSSICNREVRAKKNRTQQKNVLYDIKRSVFNHRKFYATLGLRNFNGLTTCISLQSPYISFHLVHDLVFLRFNAIDSLILIFAFW